MKQFKNSRIGLACICFELQCESRNEEKKKIVIYETLLLDSYFLNLSIVISTLYCHACWWFLSYQSQNKYNLANYVKTEEDGAPEQPKSSLNWLTSSRIPSPSLVTASTSCPLNLCDTKHPPALIHSLYSSRYAIATLSLGARRSKILTMFM